MLLTFHDKGPVSSNFGQLVVNKGGIILCFVITFTNVGRILNDINWEECVSKMLGSEVALWKKSTQQAHQIYDDLPIPNTTTAVYSI